MSLPIQRTNDPDLNRYLQALEARIARLEQELGLHSPAGPAKTSAPVHTDNRADAWEWQIGQNWFAKTGIAAITLGILFLLAFPHRVLPAYLPGLFGFILSAIYFALAFKWRSSAALIAKYLFGSGMLVAYFASLRLYYFAEQPAMGKPWMLAIACLVVAFNLLLSYRRKSVYLAAFSLTLGFVTAILAAAPLFIFVLLSFLAAVAAFFYLHKQWGGLLLYAMAGVYFCHFLWFVNNPLLGNRLKFVAAPEYNLYFVLLYLVLFAGAILVRRFALPESGSVARLNFFNCAGSFGLFFIMSVTMFQSHASPAHLSASGIFLALGTGFWLREKSKYATFFYSMTAYTALSVAIIFQFARPAVFVVLCWQSLLVISTALWFRSKFIVLANFIIFLLIFIAFLLTTGTFSVISMSFGVVALLSARIMNWQKQRLELKTEFMRNAYLSTAFIIFPYTLFRALPGTYVGLSWVGVALFYYIVGSLIKNKKYRWMALLTLLLAVIYIFPMAIVRLNPIYRIISFLVVGTVMLIVSLLYTRFRKKSETGQQ